MLTFIRMQSIEARKNYSNTFECALKIFRDEGVLTFWSGAVPRLVRLILSGGIVFTMYCSPDPVRKDMQTDSIVRYEKTMEGLDTLDPERKYI